VSSPEEEALTVPVAEETDPTLPDAVGHRSGEAPASSTEPQSRLDEEGDAAADYLEELLDIADLDGDIDIEIRGGRVYVSIQSEEAPGSLGELVGAGGETLEALQELARLAVLSGTGQRSRFVLDIDGYRAGRADELRGVAREAIASVSADGAPVHLAPMSAYERKLVHDLVAEAGLVSDSEGEGSRRHVVIHPAED